MIFSENRDPLFGIMLCMPASPAGMPLQYIDRNRA
jgi:hypothetical protein